MDGVLGDLSSGRVKLRKTNVVSDSSAPKLSGINNIIIYIIMFILYYNVINHHYNKNK